MEIQVDLSDREHEILGLLADGLTNKEIAGRTGLTLYTIKWYLKEIYSKLHVSNRTQAVTRAQDLNLFNDEPKPSRIRTNLPNMLVPVVGRQREAKAIQALLSDNTSRLITIYGLGGMGKTTLALDVGHQVVSDFPDGVFFVPLAQSNGQIYSDIARVLNYENGKDIESLAAFLYHKHVLLILDNFEPFLDYAGDLAFLLQSTKHLRLLVTSRERLNLQSEVVFTLDGLTVTPTSDEQTNPAYALFLQRVRASVGSFKPTSDEKRQINAICKLLHGMPLAIEMAAKWSSILPLQETYTQLSNSLDLLAIDEKDRPTRHQSVRVTFDYSFRLLPDETQTVLMKMAIFAPDGFTWGAAQAVTGITPHQLKQLLDHVLIQRSDDRFSLHPLIRQYLTEKLKQNAAVKQRAQTDYQAYYFQFVADSLTGIRDDMDATVLAKFSAERQNITQTWWAAMQQKEFDALIPMVDMGSLYDLSDAWFEAKHLFTESLRLLPPEQTILRGRILSYLSAFALRAEGHEQTLVYAQETAALLEGTPYSRDIAFSLCHVTMVESLFHRNWERCLVTLEQIERLSQREDFVHDAYSRLMVGCADAAARHYAGRYAEAIPFLEKMPVPVWHEIRLFLAEAHIHMGNLERARHVLGEMQRAAYEHGNRRSAIGAGFFLALLDADPDDLPDAITDTMMAVVDRGFDYPVISVFYWATGYFVRHQQRWAMLIFNSHIHVLHRLGETFLMYDAILQTADTFVAFQIDKGVDLLALLLADPDCPSEIQKRAKDNYPQAAAAPNQLENNLLGAVTKALLKDLTP